MRSKAGSDKSVLITGGTSGLGLELVKIFLKNGYVVYATGRKEVSIPGFEDKFMLFQVELSDLKQVASTIEAILQSSEGFDIIINNAGVLSPPDFIRTTDGLEYTFQVNFLSHLLINEIILRKTKKQCPIKIAAVTSPIYRIAETDINRQMEENNYSSVKAYSASKLYLALMCRYLPNRYQDVNFRCFSFDPGTFSSGIYRTQKQWFRTLYQIASPFMRNPSKVANIFGELLTEEDIRNGAVYDIRKRIRQIPEIDSKAIDAFWRYCLGRIEPFLK